MSGEFVELFADRPLRDKVYTRVVQTIQQSFLHDKSRVTTDEVRRRFKICESKLRMLRSDFGWAYERILDEMPTALRAELDGIPWDPATARMIWSPAPQL
jgi:hypothetical protein